MILGTSSESEPELESELELKLEYSLIDSSLDALELEWCEWGGLSDAVGGSLLTGLPEPRELCTGEWAGW